MESSSFSGSSTKRAKAPVNITQVASCLVDECNADLSLCREYHRRHKVCEMHSKSSKVTIAGREQRFCQQCSRFHSLVEFDEGKRSCRKRLDGHNKRRRKPQTDLLPRNSVHDFSTPPGTRILSFSNPRILPSSVVSSSWSGIVKPENNDMALYNNNLNHVETQNYAFSPHSNNYKGVSFDPDGVNESNQVIALSLLSSSVPNNNTTREFGFIHPEPIVPVQVPQSLVHNLDYSGLSQFSFTQERKEVVSAVELSHGGPCVGATNVHFPETFRNVPEGSSSGGLYM